VNLSEGTVDEGTDANGNGNDNDMADAVMPAGNGVYTGVVTVGAVDDGEYMISITGTDDSENESDPVTVSAVRRPSPSPQAMRSEMRAKPLSRLVLMSRRGFAIWRLTIRWLSRVPLSRCP
jgi:hypothetical protein